MNNIRTLMLSTIALALAGGCAMSETAAAPTDRHDDDHDRSAIVLDGGEGARVEFPLHATWRLADAASNEAGMSFFEIGIAAGAAGAPPHRHTAEDEFFYVRKGAVTFMADGARRTIGEGGFVLLPRNGWHALWNTGEEDAILLVGTSKGNFDDFFDAVAMQVQAENASTPDAVGAIVGRLGAERGIIIDMSLVPSDVAALYGLPQ